MWDTQKEKIRKTNQTRWICAHTNESGLINKNQKLQNESYPETLEYQTPNNAILIDLRPSFLHEPNTPYE